MWVWRPCPGAASTRTPRPAGPSSGSASASGMKRYGKPTGAWPSWCRPAPRFTKPQAQGRPYGAGHETAVERNRPAEFEQEGRRLGATPDLLFSCEAVGGPHISSSLDLLFNNGQEWLPILIRCSTRRFFSALSG